MNDHTPPAARALIDRFAPHKQGCRECEDIAIDGVMHAVLRYQGHRSPPYTCCVGDPDTGHAFDCRRPVKVPLLARLEG